MSVDVIYEGLEGEVVRMWIKRQPERKLQQVKAHLTTASRSRRDLRRSILEESEGSNGESVSEVVEGYSAWNSDISRHANGQIDR